MVAIMLNIKNPLKKDNQPGETPENKVLSRKDTLLITFAAMVIVYILWNVEALSPVLYPFRLFVTYVHEAGHSSMALLTGGTVGKFVVESNGAGVAWTAGGSRALIIPAGYLGTAFFGAVLFYILNTRPYAKTISIILGIMLIAFSVLYAGRTDGNDIPLALIIGVLGGGGLIALGWKVGKEINLLLLNILALITGLNAILDIRTLTRITRVTDTTCGDRSQIMNDAAAFTCQVARPIPPIVWAILWGFIAVLMLGAAAYYSILRPVLNDVKTGKDGEKESQPTK
jgi:hypothetical protein